MAQLDVAFDHRPHVWTQKRLTGSAPPPAKVADERVGFKTAVTPSGYERVILPVFQITNEQRRVRESQNQLVVFETYHDVSVPRICVASRIFRKRE